VLRPGGTMITLSPLALPAPASLSTSMAPSTSTVMYSYSGETAVSAPPAMTVL
jgi:hypothetical protein